MQGDDEMEIKAKCKYDYETCKAISRIDAYRKSNPKKVVAFRMILCIVLMISNFLVADFCEIPIGYTVSLMVVVVLIIDMFMYFVMPKIQYNSMSKMKNIGNDYIFRDEEFTVSSDSEEFSGRNVTKYTILVKVYETEKYFFIYISKRQLYVVDKATIEGGTAEDLREKLSSVLGKKYIRCKY